MKMEETKDLPQHALISIKKDSEDGKDKFCVYYCCCDSESYFFSNILKPLFGNEVLGINVEISEVIKEENLPEDYRINICVHTSKDLLTGFANNKDSVNLFSQESLLSTFEQQEKKKYPIIHISLDDSFLESLYGIAVVPKLLPRSYSIMDSSIWNYLVFIDKEIRFFKINILRALNSICRNYDQELYSLEVSYEYADLNARLLNESYLTGTHAEGVSPFIFHSERRIQRSGLISWASRNKKNLQWRLLLLDDRVKLEDKKDEPGNNKKSKSKDNVKDDSDVFLTKWNGGPSNKTKADIISDRLTELKFNTCVVSSPSEELDYDIELVCVDTVERAKEMMMQYQFDIILLDYLLKDDYGYRLLHEVENESQIKGTHGKCFFMFISAFTTAVHERLLAEGLNRNEKYWYIGEGACPTNTPELFKYRLLHIMDRRLDQTGIKRLSDKNILSVVKKIYERGDGHENVRDRIKNVRLRANEAYHKILGFHYDYFLLKDKDKGKSALVDSFLKGKDHFGAMLEHLLQLVHLTAFGTVRQWNEIWEECQFLMRTIDDNNNDVRSLKNEIVAAIESYVIDLKSE